MAVEFRLGLGAQVGDATMSSIDCARSACVDIGMGRKRLEARSLPAINPLNVVRLFAVALAAASLAACAQSSVVSQRSERGASRQASFEPTATRHVAVAKRHTPFARRDAADTRIASSGMASFYTEGTRTASGEKFNTLELTAAHPTLPFGTKLRVTNAATGRSVTVRVNDRGPYVPGRVVDVSYSAADALGMVGKGVAKVKLDVVQ
jgi:rare lipoprotein A